jgi:beta-glucanase (GH16 family)
MAQPAPSEPKSWLHVTPPTITSPFRIAGLMREAVPVMTTSRGLKCSTKSAVTMRGVRLADPGDGDDHRPAGDPAPHIGLGASAAERFQPGPAEAAARYAGGGWRPVWSEEFQDPPAPSPARWTYEHGMLRNHELQYYTDRRENARVEGGQLVITARHEPWEGAGYTSASLTTRGRFSFTYGKLEIRAKIPTGRGTWPALWLLPESGALRWPHGGEIDLMENIGCDPQKLHFTVHTGAFNHVLKTQRSKAVVLDRPWDDFHRYGLLWTHERLEFFLDGEKVSEFANDGQGNEHWPFDSPMVIIMNLAIGGAWGGQKGVDESIFPVEYRISYVRVWQAGAR